MSIFNKGFAKFVKEQLDTRKTILSNSGSNDNEILGNNSRQKNYLNYQSRTPFVRLSSGVDIPDSYPILTYPKDGQDVSTTNEAGIKLAQMLGTELGMNLAGKNVIEGGTRDISYNIGQQSIDFDPHPSINNLKKGFDILGADSTYGIDKGFDNFNIDDPDNIINTSGDEFGIRPMPGITNVVINSRSTTSVGLKGLRECTISIKCHSLSQLQSIELLYMRPGYTALLEWGHSVYFNHNEDDVPTQNIHYIDIFDGNKTRFEVYDEIFEEKIKSNGNYDAILGKVNNFSWTADDNGGYDITINIISMNDIIDSLKINQVVIENSNKEDNKKDQVLAENSLKYVFKNILNSINYPKKIKSKSFKTDDQLIKEEKERLTKALETRAAKEFVEKIEVNVHGIVANSDGKKLRTSETPLRIEYNALQSQARENVKKNVKKQNSKIDKFEPKWYRPNITYKAFFKENKKLHQLLPDELISYFLLPLKVDKDKEAIWNVYFKFKDVITFINTACIPWEGTNPSKRKKIIQIKDLDKDDICRSHPAHISVDPSICLIEPSFTGVYGSGELTDEDIEKRDADNLDKLINDKKILDINLFNPSLIGRKIKKLNDAFNKYGIIFSEDETFAGISSRITSAVLDDRKGTGLQADSIYEITVTNGNNTSSLQLEANNDDRTTNNLNNELAKLKKYIKDNANTFQKGKSSTSSGTDGIVFQYGERKNDTLSPNIGLEKFTDFKVKGKGKNRYKARTQDFVINAQYIIDTVDKSQDKDGNVFLKDFMTNLFRGLEQATGQVNNFAFTPYEGDFDDDGKPINVEVVRIIDEAMVDADFENKDKYYEFPLLKYNSLITDYKLSSTISNAISYTVSIGAQNVGAGHATSGENSVFNAFNQGIKDRLAEPIIDQVNTPDNIALLDEKKRNNLKDSIYYVSDILKRIRSNSTFPSDTSTAKKLLADYINYSTTNKPANSKLFYSFTPFPVSLSLTLDGISGIAVGSIIRLPTDRLPLLYRYLDPEDKDSFNQAKVAFIITGVDHTVDDRGWFTNLTCQMIMMPRKSDETKADEELKGNTKADSDKDQEIKDIEDETQVEDNEDVPLTWDKYTNKRIKKLHPKIQRDVALMINEAENQLGLKFRLTNGFRSIQEQNNLYNQGRTTPGSKVTNAKGGKSYHNYGLAIDLVVIDSNRKADYKNQPKNGKKLYNTIAKKYGFEWGGNWKTFKDYPHFQKTFGYKVNTLLALYESDNNTYPNIA